MLLCIESSLKGCEGRNVVAVLQCACLWAGARASLGVQRVKKR